MIDTQIKRIGVTLVKVFAGLGLVIFLIVAMVIHTTNQPRSARRSQCVTNLRNVTLALQAYYIDHQSFPPAYIADENGRPIHSWRVLILPYLDGQDIYDQYDFSEPWNSPNNKMATDQYSLSHIFSCPEGESDYCTTMAVVGQNTMWPGTESVTYEDVRDGQSQTIHLIEIKDSTSHWSEPVDVQFSDLQNRLTTSKGFTSHHRGIVNATFVDGTTRSYPDDVDQELLRRLLLRNDGLDVSNY